MGFNDTSVDFYIDAVLTDHGRQQLARNDGSFSATRFRFGDDEIDYRNWNALTGSDNKDDKILDTPIFEAFTNEIIALRYPLVTIRNSTLQYIPLMVANPSTVSLKARTDTTGGGVSIKVSQQATNSQVVIPAELTSRTSLRSRSNRTEWLRTFCRPTAGSPRRPTAHSARSRSGYRR